MSVCMHAFVYASAHAQAFATRIDADTHTQTRACMFTTPMR